MNYLAHIYLSGDDKEVKIGNFIADSIKGKAWKNYPPDIQKGILLHRKIDTYTDRHPIVRRSAKRLFDKHGHYGSVIVDMFYDHFLAKNWSAYHPTPLEKFVDDFYRLLQDHHDLLPKRVQNFLPYMIAHNWLVSYATIPGIETILSQMSTRSKNNPGMQRAVAELKEHYPEFESEFTAFFKDLIAFVREQG